MKFTKMHGLGNDYVYIDCTGNKNIFDNPSELSKKISDRHFGVGSDGLILIKDSNICDFRMQMFNADGSEAEMCGNGIRCVGKYVYDFGLTDKSDITIETKAGVKKLKLNVENNKVKTVTVDMGEPILNKEEIPFVSDSKFVELKVLDREFVFTPVSMGNPHAITFIKDLDTFDIDKYGKIVESDKHFPNKTNVEFIEILDKNNIKMRVYERGTGETLACGTGASASVVASYLNNLTDRNVNVKLLGGILNINYNEDGHVYMTGEATTVFNGEIDL
ncbi:MAG: diaminopimelate epimerase [Bacilli bacterium]|nr:diaminopimelate epimerase [Bacilli bacterium]